MSLPADYISGTITLTNGSPDFTGTGTGWQAADFREGDILLGIEDHAGQVYVIAAITGNAAGTLTQEWAGTSGTYTYRMRYEWDSSRVSAQARAMVELLGNGNLESIASLTGPGVVVLEGPHSAGIRPFTDFINGVAYNVQVDTLADRDAYDGQSAGFAVLVADVGDGRSAIYSKASNTSGDWTDPAYITGPVGPLVTLEAGTTTTLPPGSDATFDVVPVTGGYELNAGIPAGEGFSFIPGGYNPATAYVKGDVVRNNNSSWIAVQATTGNAPPVLPVTSNAFWELLAAAGVNGTGTGDVVGPASAVEDRIAVFDGTTGKLIKDGGSTIAGLAPADGSISNTKLANVPTATIKGRVEAGTGVPTDLTSAQVLTLVQGAGGYGRSNILGTVAQAAGVPTGAIIERASNANGQYVRFADGTQICWGRVTQELAISVAYWGGFRSAGAAVNYPAVFASLPSVFAGNSGDPGAFGANAVNTGGNTQTFINFTAVSSQGSATRIADWLAIGRWF